MVSKEECKILCKSTMWGVLFLGILAVLCMYAVRKPPDPPEFTIRRFYVPNLNKTFTDFHYKMIDTVSIDLGFEIKDTTESDVYYDAVKLGLYYYYSNATVGEGDNGCIPVGNTSIHHFRQSSITKHAVDRTVQTFGMPWEEAQMTLLKGNFTTFMVDLVSDIRYGKLRGLIITKTYKVKGSVNVPVNDHGFKAVPEYLKFTLYS